MKKALRISMVESERLQRLRLVGARSCSIEGKLAAELQLEDDVGGRWTLFRAPSGGAA